ncbi:hypothetical protein G6F50_018430 [Rhizopus delemar]|uniref:Uncharacterized protein n=1 Tax=Rhizopus delemar TaxID=936053 RepID=A0A9P6XMG9_9FUNG|nr:hypothetical protein G6F50_018430 [Rhizopus delemar]
MGSASQHLISVANPANSPPRGRYRNPAYACLHLPAAAPHAGRKKRSTRGSRDQHAHAFPGTWLISSINEFLSSAKIGTGRSDRLAAEGAGRNATVGDAVGQP